MTEPTNELTADEHRIIASFARAYKLPLSAPEKLYLAGKRAADSAVCSRHGIGFACPSCVAEANASELRALGQQETIKDAAQAKEDAEFRATFDRAREAVRPIVEAESAAQRGPIETGVIYRDNDSTSIDRGEQGVRSISEQRPGSETGRPDDDQAGAIHNADDPRRAERGREGSRRFFDMTPEEQRRWLAGAGFCSMITTCQKCGGLISVIAERL